MILRVTESIGRGSLSLPTVGYPIKAGAVLTLKDSEYYASDIQSAIRNKFLEVKESPIYEDQQSYVKITNISGGRLGINSNILAPSEEMYIPSDDAKINHNLQVAARANLVTIEDVIKEKKLKPKKTTKKAVKKDTKKTTKKVAKKAAKKREDKKFINSERAKLEKTDMQSWDPHKQETVLKEESNLRVAKTASSIFENAIEKEEGTQIGEVDFSDEGKTKLRKKGEKRPASSKKKTAKKKGKKSLKPVGTKREEPNSEDWVDRDQMVERSLKANLPPPPKAEDLSFVDKEQTAERLKKAGIAPFNSEVE